MERSTGNAQPSLAFAFDIDGVLIRGASVIPEAKRALAILEGANEMNWKIPYILITNGGGVSETERCHKLTNELGVNITPSMLVQAHTILRDHSREYADQDVLVLGGRRNGLRQVAESYGFKHVWTPLDIKAWDPQYVTDFSSKRISAAFIFHDPRNWALDIQILLDVIRSRGFVGKVYTYDGTEPPPVRLVFCNPDLLWRSEFPVSRLGQGAFREAFQAVYKSLTGVTYPIVQYGKPTKPTYDFAERMLRQRILELVVYLLALMLISLRCTPDNPESDIAGANGAGWHSILVRTGVYEGGRGSPTHKPTYIADNVLEAVQWAIQREREGAVVP
ncbi:HAD-like domain-containing protein [Vararia minispora EC-137]|uniref:HAD-like domain-containing protein n=1 Tax=Vararia minispora EC-137 TaxID=1314806 RepID=A0ACB8QQ56_9AGAM|nr:HAD-like domain-containing protein [Vararia minispora EC-137]